MSVFGLDIGGSGIKGAPVLLETGELTHERVRVPTPEGAHPEDVVRASVEVITSSDWGGPVGVGFPGVVKDGVTLTAANVHGDFIGFDLERALETELRVPVSVVNDADAAGLAEVRWGAARGVSGTVLMLTVGTGIGSALFVGGRLVPNTELGHISLPGGHDDAERWASDRARKDEDLSWKEWAERFEVYLRKVEDLFWPDLIVVGGGISKKSEKFLPRIETRTEVVPAKLFNNAGIAGAALAHVPEGPAPSGSPTERTTASG
jgi:polyphosphate glucokinase